MAGDPSFGRPWERFAPVSSFQHPVLIPGAGPFDAPLVALPCVNTDWLARLLGAAAQLENPSAWDELATDAARLAVVQAAQELRCGLAAMEDCLPAVQYRLDNCNLQTSADGGATWVTVPGWAENFGACVRTNIPAPPTNPRDVLGTQEACNLAGFIAGELIQGSIQQTTNGINLSLTELNIAQNIANYLAQFGFVWTGWFITAVHDLYAYISSGTLAHFTSAETDPVLKGLLTCAIFSAIVGDGAVTDANFASIEANICGLSYVYADVITAICQYVTNMGATGLRSLQNPGALVDEDCSACSTSWEYEWDFTTGLSGGWATLAGLGSLVGGQGWESVITGGNICLAVAKIFPETLTITKGLALTQCQHAGGGCDRNFYYTIDGGSTWNVWGVLDPAAHADECESHNFTGTMNGIRVDLCTCPGTGDTNFLRKFCLHGTGAQPFGVSPCTISC